MDTASHLLLGATLAGLSYVEPAVARDANLAYAVLVCTLIGSHAPDFDALLRMKSFASYIQHHRGITHSIPALFIWPAIITLLVGLGYDQLEHGAVLFTWTLLAVGIHIFLDTLNSYGVQSGHPFTKQWIHLDILNIFEPFLFLLHGAGLALWLFRIFDPAFLFPWVYAMTFGYIALRAWQHHTLLSLVARELNVAGISHVFPSFKWSHWRFVIESENTFYTGTIVRSKVNVEMEYPKEEQNTIIQATMGIDGVRAFLSFAQRIHVTCREVSDGYEVSWSDVRFSYDRKLPFGVDVLVDREMNVVSQRVGWRKKAWDPPFV